MMTEIKAKDSTVSEPKPRQKLGEHFRIMSDADVALLTVDN